MKNFPNEGGLIMQATREEEVNFTGVLTHDLFLVVGCQFFYSGRLPFRFIYRYFRQEKLQ